MRVSRRCVLASVGLSFLVLAELVGSHRPAGAAEGPVAAGPIGGSDIRSAILPPPGLYGGVLGLYNGVTSLRDGSGHPPPALDAVDLRAKVGGGFLAYVPNYQLFGGSIGLIGLVTAGEECGQVVSTVPRRCTSGFGDPYVELDWSRFFGRVRPSRDAGAFPIMEGLNISLGIGAVIPVGHYDQQLQASHGISLGNHTFDIAPSIAFTYTTTPLIAEGTEFSAKIYWNQYSTNSVTGYKAAPLVDVDFAITEHFGRWQVGLAGVYLRQVDNDRQNGVFVPPDGRRMQWLALGSVLNYDIASLGAAIRVKALTVAIAENAGMSPFIVVVGLAKKLH